MQKYLSKKEAMAIADYLFHEKTNQAEEAIELSTFLLDNLSRFNSRNLTWSDWNLDKQVSSEVQFAINVAANELNAGNVDEVISELYRIATFLIENRTIYSRSKYG